MADAARTLSGLVEILRAEGLLEGSVDAGGIVVLGVANDSRLVEPGHLFLAWSGVVNDGHDFAAQAEASGATAVLVERPVHDVSIPQIVVTDGRRAAAVAADWFFGSPWRDLLTVGITGTNGKTTTALLARHLLSRDRKSAAIGTLGLVEPNGAVRPGTEGLTTPGPVEIAHWLSELSKAGVSTVSLEASSHALNQRRLDGIRFDIVAFTTFGRDHLDYHGSVDEYLAAKLRLLELLKPGATAVINGDEPVWQNALRHDDLHHEVPRLLYGCDDSTELRGTDLRLERSRTLFRMAFGGSVAEVELPLPGEFNVSNALAAAGIALTAGASLDEVADRLRTAPQIPGRMEVVVSEPFSVLIDFAHTPDALDNVLATLRPLVSGRLIVVFGAGGDRDRAKRPLMASAVSRYADLAVVTSDNPRTEDPERIVDEVMAGLGRSESLRVTDRRQAIGTALAEARVGDLVLLAGKGHERYQVVGTERRSFDEREIVRDALVQGGMR